MVRGIAEVRSQKSEVRSKTLALLDAIASGGNPQDRLGALSVGELNSPRVAPLHRLLRFETNVDVLTALATAIFTVFNQYRN
ncbi:hypothetical protein BJP36_15155 [Moorena producens JHB]|uniref:Uncharacterized protein n=1 Tax=Moorena producens (strain JHB) TaxID=1454205 RepID=A0A1D9G080_MOOP1|nr:hypothetical protein [Moorena producens]AOY81042.1 hypothetical protein BJP36_15155 [Moorena producens JHB]